MASNNEPLVPEVVAKATPNLAEIGATGLKRQGGRIDEEFLTELKGDRWRRVIEEMRNNDPIVGAVLFAIEMVIRGVEWASIPAGTTPQDAEAADFLASNLIDMSHSWPEFIAESVSFLPHGWSLHEIVWKVRKGEQSDMSPTPTSMFDDGRTGIRKLPIRAQDSLDDWLFDDEGGIAGMRQRPAPDYDLRDIPIQKSLLFRTTAAKNNPEGRSAFRNAYRPWYFKRAIQEIEAIGIERELAGFPWARVPSRFFDQNASDTEKAALEEWVRTMRDIRTDSLQGLVYPSEFDSNGNQLYEIGLLSTEGTRGIATGPVIDRYNVEIASTVLADFILIGHQKVGSFALASTKTDLFSVAVNGWLQAMSEVLNKHLVPRLFKFNTFNVEQLPTLQPSVLGKADLKELGEYITSLAGVGYDLFPNNALEAALLQAADLPEPTEDERDQIDTDPLEGDDD